MRKRRYRSAVLACLLAVSCACSGQFALAAGADESGGTGAQVLADAKSLEKTNEQKSADAKDLEEDARQTADDMLAGNFGSVTEKFDETMAAALSEEALKASWDSVAVLLGKPKETVSVESMEVSGSCVCIVTQEFENFNLQIQISYDEEEKISGLYMRPVAAAQKTQEPETAGAENPAEKASGSESQIDSKESAAAGAENPAAPKDSAAEAEINEEDSAGYEEFEMTVTGDPSCPLGATLTLPEDAEKPPVVILVQGSGSSNRDEQIGNNRPFADIAHGLAQRGIAVLRYDKRFFTYPELAMEISGLNLRREYLDDVSAAVALMQEEERVDKSRIFVLGHSLGGSLVPAIAAEHPELSGIIAMAGSLRPLWELSYDQNQELLSTIDRDSLPESEQELLETQTAQLEADMEILRSDALEEQPADASLLGLPACYWQSIREYCGMNFIDEVEMPILVLQGDADFQVFPDKDYTLWQETLADRENAQFHLYKGLNHLMMETQGKRDVTEYDTAGHVDAQVLDDIASFVNAAA